MPHVRPKIAAANPLEVLSALLKSDMDGVNTIILDKMGSNVPLIPQLAEHLISAGGKRIRPLLTLAAAKMFGYDGTRQHALAACVEFIHTATLLHDDVVDESDLRRGRPSANARFGNAAAVLVGDFLFSRSFQLMTEDGSLEVLRILSDASAVIAEGEVMQLSTARNLDTTEEQYLTVVASKTAALFSAACEVGAVVAGRPPIDCKTLRDYGTYLGVAFQIADDTLDYAALEENIGKSPGDDFKEGKMTLPVIRALAQATKDERTFWRRCLSDLDQEDADFTHACTLLKKHGAIESAAKTAQAYAEKGRKALETLPDNAMRRLLSDLITFVVERDR